MLMIQRFLNQIYSETSLSLQIFLDVNKKKILKLNLYLNIPSSSKMKKKPHAIIAEKVKKGSDGENIGEL